MQSQRKELRLRSSSERNARCLLVAGHGFRGYDIAAGRKFIHGASSSPHWPSQNVGIARHERAFGSGNERTRGEPGIQRAGPHRVLCVERREIARLLRTSLRKHSTPESYGETLSEIRLDIHGLRATPSRE